MKTTLLMVVVLSACGGPSMNGDCGAPGGNADAGFRCTPGDMFSNAAVIYQCDYAGTDAAQVGECAPHNGVETFASEACPTGSTKLNYGPGPIGWWCCE